MTAIAAKTTNNRGTPFKNESDGLIAEHRIVASKAKEILSSVLTEEIINQHLGHWIVIDVDSGSHVIEATSTDALSTFLRRYGSGRRAWTEQIAERRTL